MSNNSVKSGNAYDLGDINEGVTSGAKKAAVLLMTLGTELSSEILKNLSDKQVQKIGVEIANLHKVTAEERRKILREFLEARKSKDFAMQGGIDYAKSLFQGAFDASKTNKIMEGIKYETSAQSFMAARKAEVNEILACLQGESAQTIAIILSNIQVEKSAQIICSLDEGLQQEVALKLGTISNISPIVIKAVDNALEKKLLATGDNKIDSSNGFDSLLDILTKVDGKTEKNIIKFLEDKSNILAERLKANMITFEDIENIDDTSIQKILKEVNIKDVAIALKGADDNISSIILKNQSSRAAQALREEISLLGALKVSQVEEAKRNIVKIIRKLEQEGVISINKGSEDDILV